MIDSHLKCNKFATFANTLYPNVILWKCQMLSTESRIGDVIMINMQSCAMNHSAVGDFIKCLVLGLDRFPFFLLLPLNTSYVFASFRMKKNFFNNNDHKDVESREWWIQLKEMATRRKPKWAREADSILMIEVWKNLKLKILMKLRNVWNWIIKSNRNRRTDIQFGCVFVCIIIFDKFRHFTWNCNWQGFFRQYFNIISFRFHKNGMRHETSWENFVFKIKCIKNDNMQIFE